MSRTSEHGVGPYEAEREAADDAREVYQAGDRPGGLTGANYERLIAACARTGITLGAFDRRILVWLAGWESETCQTVIGLIDRAHAHTTERR